MSGLDIESSTGQVLAGLGGRFLSKPFDPTRLLSLMDEMIPESASS